MAHNTLMEAVLLVTGCNASRAQPPAYGECSWQLCPSHFCVYGCRRQGRAATKILEHVGSTLAPQPSLSSFRALKRISSSYEIAFQRSQQDGRRDLHRERLHLQRVYQAGQYKGFMPAGVTSVPRGICPFNRGPAIVLQLIKLQ